MDRSSSTKQEHLQSAPHQPVGVARNLAVNVKTVTARLKAYFRLHVGSNSADDLVQETWVRALGSNIGRANCPDAYLMGIAHNVVVDLRRRQAWESSIANAWSKLIEIALESTMSIPVPIRSDTAHRGWIDDWLVALPRSMREVYVQRVELGKSQRQTAIALELSHRRVRTLEAKLRSSVLRFLRERGGEPPRTLKKRPTQEQGRTDLPGSD
jgi:RNA polymerase sigma factor (sigma-70 family)